MISALPLLLLAVTQPANVKYDRQLLLDAIRLVESGGNPRATGDRGRSRGAYQVGPKAWADAGVSWPYSPFNEKRSRLVAYRYMRLYASADAPNHVWARIWNGGPAGHKKESTLKYWRKVKATMRKLNRQTQDGS